MPLNAAETTAFFDRYATALLAHDEAAIATLYAVPSLILFPGQSIAVSDPQQTAQFWAAAWEQYDGVDAVEKEITILAQGPGSIWADVRWSYGDNAGEHFCYQLIEGADGPQIAVLTPLD
jgi:hypothetical protein